MNLTDFPNLKEVTGIVPLMWREHCLECAMPLCYQTCNLYFSRIDKRCLRFEKGILPVSYQKDLHRGAMIGFRRWAKLQTNLPHTLGCVSTQYESRLDFIYDLGARLIRSGCNVLRNYRLCQIYASLAERFNTCFFEKNSNNATHFYAVINNHENKNLTLLLEILSDNQSIYKTSFLLAPGWNEYVIPIYDINSPLKSSKQNFLRAYLNDNESGLLEFRYFDFVKISTNQELKPAKKIKCVAWDLDNTLWKGVIGDIGKENVLVSDTAIKLVRDLDERGILQTIVSKNTYDVVWPFIEELGLSNYFLYPAINWGRKSQNILAIAKELNINVDTFALIDDNPFERNEVKQALPQARVYDAIEISQLLVKDEFTVEISSETRNRRMSYINESKRKRIRASWDGDYNSFLKSCEMKLNIFAPKDATSANRCLELINRSNQYNISGVRYTNEEFSKLLIDKETSCYAISVTDKYGDYGIVGFASVFAKDNFLYLKDFVMSCRVAQKKVERAFIHELISNSVGKELIISLKKTQRNQPLQEEFKKMDITVDIDNSEMLKMHISLLDYVGNLDDGIFSISKSL